MEKVIEVKNLVKKYGKLIAVDDISFEVEKGEIFGLLGENGAGKTTTLEIIEGLRKPTSGHISVLGHDIRHGTNNTKSKIGVQLQSSAYYNFLTLREILHLFGDMYPKHLDPDKLLESVGLKEKAKSYISALSGGQKQRFSIIASLINDPEIVFLDEPTTGLDPVARRNLWEIIAKIRQQGKTIILTTHYMEEAEILCDRVAIMDKGKIIAIGAPHELAEKTSFPYKVRFLLGKNTVDFSTIENLGPVKSIAGKPGDLEVQLKSRSDLGRAFNLIYQMNPASFSIGHASLEDLFIELTGRRIEE